MTIPFIEENDQTIARREHLEKLRQLVGNVYPNKFERSNATGEEDTISRLWRFGLAIKEKYFKEGEQPSQETRDAANADLNQYRVRTSGRVAVPPRVMGKAAFVHLSDGVGRLQIYVRKQDVKAINNDTYQILETENSGWELFNLLDHGDFVGVGGFLFVTKTGELSIHVETVQFLAKAMLPMPDKLHGIEDPETRRRYRYIDLIASSLKVERAPGELTTREVFERRARLISGMRGFLDRHGYIEVETPMLTPKATGAAAKPFKTHHNALDIDLYARIAPELYLKRLTVGGFEKVYELNRNFRNEGVDATHNPEFTMLEFYQSYLDVNGMMDFAERMIKESVQKTTGGSLRVKYGWAEIDFSKFERLTMKEAIHKSLSFNTELQKDIDDGLIPAGMFPTFSDLIGETYDVSWLDDPQRLRTLAAMGEISSKQQGVPHRDYRPRKGKLVAMSSEESEKLREQTKNKWKQLWQEAVAEAQKTFDNSKDRTEQAARDLIYIFESGVEWELTQPTFITDYPKIISPLSKASPQNSQIAERFELFIAGMECANGFSELNDPQEQYERFLDQARERERGDDEAMVLDEDYIRALSYGMPPAAGIGIGIDRLVMLLTSQHSIRDVILFPHMRPETKVAEEAENEKKGEN